MIKFQQKLIFTEQEFNYNTETQTNERTERILFQEWADVRNAQTTEILNGSQVTENAVTHTAVSRWLPDIASNMLCHRRIRNPDRSITFQYFQVISFEPFSQENRYMLIKLSEVQNNGN